MRAGAFDVLGDQPDAAQSIDVDQRMGEAVGIGLDAVCQRVKAGRGRHRRRHGRGQGRIQIGRIGHQVGADDALLQVFVLVAENGDRRHLAAGAGRGRDAGQPQGAASDEIRPKDVHDALAAVEQRRDQLGDVHGAAAAQAHDRIGLAGARDRQGGLEFLQGRLAEQVMPQGRLDAGGLERLDQRPAQEQRRLRRDDEHRSRPSDDEVVGAARQGARPERERAHVHHADQPLSARVHSARFP